MNCPKIKKYSVSSSGKSTQEVMCEINRAVYQGHGPDWSIRGGQTPAVEVDLLFEYGRFLAALKLNENIKVVPFKQLLNTPFDGKTLCAIRHDVDLDIRCALELARQEQDHGMSTTYFILHTAPYYGEFSSENQFKRHDSMANVYLNIQNLGHEIALHTDPLKLYQDHELDGAQAIVEEISWLRSNGIKITGTTAHNSAGVYGAENFAIFKGRPQTVGGDPDECPDEIFHNGKWSPLGVLSEKELGLTYEANDVSWQKHSSIKYGATRGANLWRWVEEANGYIVKNRSKATNLGKNSYFIQNQQLIEKISEVSGEQYMILVVHPVYYGARHNASRGPTQALSRQIQVVNKKLGWQTWKPLSIFARQGIHNGVKEYQSLLYANNDGMLDSENIPPNDACERILILGGSNLEGSALTSGAQLQNQLANVLNKKLKSKPHIRKLAHPEMGLSRCYGWLDAQMEFKPNTVILGIGSDLVALNIPKYWTKLSGASAKFPIGDYLHWDGEETKLVERSEIGKLFLGAPSGIDVKRKTSILALSTKSLPKKDDIKYVTKIVYFLVNVLTELEINVVFLVENCGEEHGIWDPEFDSAKRNKLVHTFNQWLIEFLQDLNVTICNPYPMFLDSPESYLMKSTNEWNSRGHQLVANLVAHSIL